MACIKLYGTIYGSWIRLPRKANPEGLENSLRERQFLKLRFDPVYPGVLGLDPIKACF